MNTLHEQVNALWDSYWRNFHSAEQQSRVSGESHLDAQSARREFAKHSIRHFLRLEQDCLTRKVDSTTLLLYKVGFMLYGDVGDDRAALNCLRSFLSYAPGERDLVIEQIFAIDMTLRAYDQSQEELANTLSLIIVENMSEHDLKQLRRAIFAAVASEFRNPDAPISVLLLTELVRACCLAFEIDGPHTFGSFFDAYKASYG